MIIFRKPNLHASKSPIAQIYIFHLVESYDIHESILAFTTGDYQCSGGDVRGGTPVCVRYNEVEKVGEYKDEVTGAIPTRRTSCIRWFEGDHHTPRYL